MLLRLSCRAYATRVSLKSKLRPTAPQSVQPTFPVRTRFAPSPTGYLHLGSLRTALYNYLLAKSTGGMFVLRLEDTDQKRLVSDAEENIYGSLRWCGIVPDEGPENGGPYGPYRQSERKHIYQKYAQQLVDSGRAYYCSCSKERLLALRESAQRLKPPTTVTYDRKCERVSSKPLQGSVIRFKSPDVYDEFTDLAHGRLHLQPQINHEDRRYDDFVIMKSDGLPTYHFANIVDDHSMKITHVIRGEEWLPATPKHIALYKAFGWTPPSYAHIPLLTSVEDKKLSKRSGDTGVLSMRLRGILPEALVNFCALFGWSPTRDVARVSHSESMTLKEIVSKFSLDNLTKGNAKVSDLKLFYFNKYHLQQRLKDGSLVDEMVDEYFPRFIKAIGDRFDKPYLRKVMLTLGPSLTTVDDIHQVHSYLFSRVEYLGLDANARESTRIVLELFLLSQDHTIEENVQKVLYNHPNIKKKDIFQAIRYAVSGGVPGLTIPLLIGLLGEQEFKRRLLLCIDSLCT